MIGPCKYFFDIPVYRLVEDRYYQERKVAIEQTKQKLFPNNSERKLFDSLPSRAVAFQDHLEHTYGGCWRYNEIVGYIRLHFLGSQIRGEYYGVAAKRIVRTRRKTFVYKSHKLAPEISIPASASNMKIASLVREYIENCRVELSGRYIDLDVFDFIAPHVDWRSLMKSQ